MKQIRLFHKILFAFVWCLNLPFTACADTGSYYGTATITAPANLGTIDLAFKISVGPDNKIIPLGTIVDNEGKTIPVASYIMLDKTLLFPVVLPKLLITDGNPVVLNGVPVACTNEINCIDVGPLVKTGNLSPSAFDLTTDDFTSVVSGRTVTRKVVLVGTTVTNGGNSLSGNYTETITGLTPQPVVVTGSFILVRPTVQTIVVALKDPNGDGCIDLNEIRSAGAYENSIEFGDISQALHLYYNPQVNLKICTKPNDLNGQQTIKDALAEYYATQKQQ